VQLTRISLDVIHLQTTLEFISVFIGTLLCYFTCKSFQYHGGNQIRKAAKVEKIATTLVEVGVGFE